MYLAQVCIDKHSRNINDILDELRLTRTLNA